MSCVVYQTNKKTGYVYAYESVSYRDPQTHQPKSKRTFIGRVDPVTKELINPEKAARLKEKRAGIKGNPSKDLGKYTVMDQDPRNQEELIRQIQDLKTLIVQQHEELMKVQHVAEASQNALVTIANVIQESVKP